MHAHKREEAKGTKGINKPKGSHHVSKDDESESVIRSSPR